MLGETIVELTSLIADPVKRAWVAKSSALLLIAGLGGEIVTHAKNNAINGTIVGFLNKQAGEAYKLGNTAKEKAGEAQERASAADERASLAQERANRLAVDVEVLRGKNEQFERESELQQRETERRQREIVSSFKAQESLQRPQEIDIGDLRRETRRLSRPLRSVTLIRLNDPIAGQYATNIGEALRAIRPAFKVKFLELSSSRFRGVIVCQNGARDLKVAAALKNAGIVTDIKKLDADECAQSIQALSVPDQEPSMPPVLSLKSLPPMPHIEGTLIFVGHRLLPRPN